MNCRADEILWTLLMSMCTSLKDQGEHIRWKVPGTFYELLAWVSASRQLHDRVRTYSAGILLIWTGRIVDSAYFALQARAVKPSMLYPSVHRS